MSEQYQIDKQVFIKLVSKFTGISAYKLKAFLEYNNTSMVFEHPTAIGITQQQLNKLEQLKELSALYNNLKDHKVVYCMKSSTAAGEYFRNYFRGIKDKERFVCVFLDTANNIITTEVMSTGTVNETPVYPREIVKKALMCDASSIMISHNHPGESLRPSPDDIKLTKLIYQAAETINIKLLDHIIVAGDRYYSFMEMGMMPDKERNFNVAAQEEDYEMEV